MSAPPWPDACEVCMPSCSITVYRSRAAISVVSIPWLGSGTWRVANAGSHGVLYRGERMEGGVGGRLNGAAHSIGYITRY